MEFKDQYISFDNLSENIDNWLKLFSTNDSISQLIKKLKDISTPLGNLLDAKQGYIPYRKTTLIKKFGEQKATDILENRLWHSTEKISDSYKKELQGKDVERYQLKWSGVYASYGEWVSTYVDLKYFNMPRLLFREITRKLPYSLIVSMTENEYINNPSIITAIPRSDCNVPLKYLLGLANSKLLSFWFVNTAPKAGKGLFPKVIVNDVRYLPIVLTNESKSKAIISLVDKVLLIKNKDASKDTSALENEIDRAVYEIYGLTDDEIEIIENQQ